VFNQAKADHVIKFFKNLKHTKGRWKGVSFTLMDWQEKALRDIFGNVRDNGYRQYNTAYIEIPKKMGKSETGAGVALYCLTADEEQAAEIYGCASDRQQASIVFDVAVDMVDQNPTLKKKIKPVLSQKRLVYMPTRSFYQVLSAESYSKHGFNVHAVVFDELHSQPNRGLFDVMTEGSGDARTQPLYFIITTAGDDPDRTSIGWEIHSLARDILTGAKIDPTFYATIYGIDRDNKRIWTGREYQTVDEVDWKDEEVWRLVNPSIDHTVPMEKVRDQFVRAQGNLAREKNFRWLRLNSWEKLKTQKWLGVDFWDLCKGKINDSTGRVCYGGLDLSSKIDMTAFVLLFPPDEINLRWVILPWFWLPEDNIAERVEKDNVPYDQWVREGYLNTTPGNVIDYQFIEEHIIKLRDKYDIKEIGYDPWNAMQTAIRLEDAGLSVAEVRQGAKSMSPPMKEIEQLVMGKKMLHGGHPVLRWNVGNVEIKIDENENIRPVKGRGKERIDGLVAMINAMNRAMLVKEEKQTVYKKRGVLWV
jgi:phage terminase large subunit-like protein